MCSRIPRPFFCITYNNCKVKQPGTRRELIKNCVSRKVKGPLKIVFMGGWKCRQETWLRDGESSVT